jgi:hypothetical protein
MPDMAAPGDRSGEPVPGLHQLVLRTPMIL